MNSESKFKEFAINRGAKLFAIASADSLSDAPEGSRPVDILPGAKSVIVVGMRMLSTVIDLLPESTIEFSADYIQTAHQLSFLTYNLCGLLEEEGCKAYPTNPHGAAYGLPERDFITPMAAFSHRHAAVAAELGQLGVHGLLLTYQFGVRVRLACVITDEFLEPSPKRKNPEKLCKPEKCGWKCVKICPVGALTRKGFEFPQYCWNYNLYGKKGLKGGAPSSCGLCLKACNEEKTVPSG